jgi:hypothetical protein
VAYGLLRLLEERGIRARLGFADPFGRPEAFLEVKGDLDKDGLVSLLADFVEEVDPTERYGLASGEDPTPEGARAALREGSPASPFLVAYVNPWWSPQNRTLRSPLNTSSGNQGFSGFLHEAVSALRKRGVRREGREAAFRRVLFVEPLLPPDPLLAEEDPHHPLFGDISAPKWHVSQRRATADQASVARYLRVLLDLDPRDVKKEGVPCGKIVSTPSTILTQKPFSWPSTSGWMTSSRPYRLKGSSSPQNKGTRKPPWLNS